MASVNKVIIVGNLGRDPEVRYLESGSAICNVSIATTYVSGQGSDKKEETEWHRCVAFGRTAEVMGEYLRKGSPVYIEGRLRTRKWQAQDGTDRYTTEIIVSVMQMLGGRGDNSGGDQVQPQQQAPIQSAPQQQAPRQQQQPVQPPPVQQQQQNYQAQGYADAAPWGDDDIPF